MTAPHDPADQSAQDESIQNQQDTADAVEQDPLVLLQNELAAVQAQLAEAKDQALRAAAEMENVRRRAQEEVSKARKFGIESFAESLVPVKDSLEAALAQTEQSAEDMRAGIEATLKQLISGFERNHLKEIAPAVGDKFDPHHHQAIANIPAEQASGTVVQTLQKGYLIADRVLRPALVTVAA
ncbi:nucleotide exchange factor GrpE [Orrella sp. NBD-18]|uniref:Protein GrpE n=1 Tax=Sheuella amnicola TaxID=2707330 RepID=A0A6B2R1K7_9BURK|nr:nucleotide exchange factor GrpE [Sheuella amnicola]NDY82877.1 nucleotide exchange factor GrpE [Sheuella amnicola]HBI84035.1 nucleotide exchange factor GrpE [Alcaligenaceae bacterium]